MPTIRNAPAKRARWVGGTTSLNSAQKPVFRNWLKNWKISMKIPIIPIATVAGAYASSPGTVMRSHSAISRLQPSRNRLTVRNGMLAAMNGIRRPQRVRQRSLFTLTYGATVMLMKFGIVEMIIPMIQFGQESPFRVSGMMLGTTVSISV